MYKNLLLLDSFLQDQIWFPAKSLYNVASPGLSQHINRVQGVHRLAEHGPDSGCPGLPPLPESQYPAQRPQDTEHIHDQEWNAQAWRLWDIEDPHLIFGGETNYVET